MKLKLLVVFGLIGLLTLSAPIHADFIQCVGAGNCNGSDNADIINGSPLWDVLQGDPGDDFLFGNGGPDSIYGQEDSDTMFGGAGSDWLDGDDESDIFLLGPDDGEYSQYGSGQDGNDTFYSFASETSTCLFLYGDADQDTTHLIGFGPFSAQHPFVQTGWGEGFILIVDPIAGGNILIAADEDDDSGVETIRGLPSPNLTILDQAAFEALNCPPVHPDIVE